jgi:hypothetical protein
MKAIYLKFPSEVDISEYVGRDVEGISVDVIGVIEGVEGWHVNMLVPDTFDVFTEFEIIPTSPRRVFGGW